MIKDIKFLATDVAPNPKEITHWVDLNEDPTGSVIKTFDGKEWKIIESEVSDEDFTELKDTVNELWSLKNKVSELQSVVDKFVFIDNDADLTNNAVYKATRNKQIVFCTYGNMSFPIHSVTVDNQQAVTQYMRSGDWRTFQLVVKRGETTNQLDLQVNGNGDTYLSDNGSYSEVDVPQNVSDLNNDSNFVTEEGLQTSIQQLQTTIQSLNTQLTSLNSQIGTLNTEITSLKERVTSLENPEPPTE